MKLLENVVYSTKHNMVFKNLLFGKPMAKGDSIRQLTIDEQVDYLYDKCCQPHSRWENVAELCMAFPELQEQMLCNLNHRNKDEIKSELESLLSFPRHDMTEIKVGDHVRHVGIPTPKAYKTGDRVRFLWSGLEAVILRIDEKDSSFQVVVRGVWYKFDLVEPAEPVRTKLIPFQASQWTPAQKVVTRKELLSVRILCVDANEFRYPVIGLIKNKQLGNWTNMGNVTPDTSEYDEDLMVVVEPKTKTLYGFWNEMENCGFVYTDEIERSDMFEYQEKEYDHTLIKFQTEIEL